MRWRPARWRRRCRPDRCRCRRRGRSATPICCAERGAAAGGDLPRHVPRSAAAGADRPGAGQQPRPAHRRRQHRRGARAGADHRAPTSFPRSTPPDRATADGGDAGSGAASRSACRHPSFELDLFGRLARRSTQADQQRLFATEAGGARRSASRLVADIAEAWLDLRRRPSLLADRRATPPPAPTRACA